MPSDLCKYAVPRWLGGSGSYSLDQRDPTNCLSLTRLQLEYHSGAVRTLVVGRGIKDESGGTRLPSCHGPADVPEAPAWQGGDTRKTNRTRSKQQLGCHHVGVGLGMGMTDGATGRELPTLYGFPSAVVGQRCHGPFGKTVVTFFLGACVYRRRPQLPLDICSVGGQY